MIHNGWIPKRLIFAAAIASLACVAVIGAIGLAYPQPVPSAALGPDWQCIRQAFVWTTCSRVTQARPAPLRMAWSRFASDRGSRTGSRPVRLSARSG